MFGNAYFGASYYGDTYWGPPGDTIESGATKKVRQLTTEEREGLEAYGKAKLGVEEITKIIPPETPESIILTDSQDIVETPPSPVVNLSQEVLDSQFEQTLQEKLRDEEDIGLILAIITAHES